MYVFDSNVFRIITFEFNRSSFVVIFSEISISKISFSSSTPSLLFTTLLDSIGMFATDNVGLLDAPAVELSMPSIYIGIATYSFKGYTEPLISF